MADLSKIILPNGEEYTLKDAAARTDISAIQTTLSGITGAIGGVTILGETTDDLSENPVTGELSTTNPITVNGESVTAVNGSLVVYNKKEFLFDGTYWHELGDLTALGALATLNSASASYTPSGTVSQPSFTGSSMSANGTFTPSGSVSAPTISIESAGSTAQIKTFASVGDMPAFGAGVSGETLILTWTPGELTTSTVKTGDASYSASTPSFTGTQASIEVIGTPSGTISQPTFNGTTATITVI